jgi:hypothetical protein
VKGSQILFGARWERIQLTSALTSASGTVGFGGIGTLPHTPWPPFLIFSASLAGAAE